MICLSCGTPQVFGASVCPKCDERFDPVERIHGANNVTQLIHGLRQYRRGAIEFSELERRFATFLDLYEAFRTAWLDDALSLAESLALPQTLQAQNSLAFEDLEDGFDCFEDIVAGFDELKGDVEAAEGLENDLRAFFVSLCSGASRYFQAQQAPEPDFRQFLKSWGGSSPT